MIETREVTIYDIAREVGVSPTTVARSISGKGRVSPVTRARVLEAVQAMGYRPSLIAQSLSHRRTNTLGVIVPQIGNTVFSPMVRGVERYACESGYNIILCDTDGNLDREKMYVDMLRRRRVDGLIVIPLGFRDAAKDYRHLLDMEARGIPVVVMEQDVSEKRLSRVVADNLGDAKRLVEHLLSIGHKRIGFCFTEAQEEWNRPGLERYEGYQAALRDAGLIPDPAMVIRTEITETDISVYTGATARLLAVPNPPTAVFAESDMLAIKLMSAMTRLGLRVPQDMAIVGFDDILTTAWVVPALTTVRQPAEELGAMAAKLVVERIEDPKHPSKLEPQDLRIAGELIVRESCGSTLPYFDVSPQVPSYVPANSSK